MSYHSLTEGLSLSVFFFAMLFNDADKILEKNGLSWYKVGGRIALLATYSNNIIDDDWPVREIISSKSHKNYDAKVNSGEWPMPELWYMHQKEWKFGEFVWHGLDIKENGIVFPVAAAFIDPGMEWLAEAIIENAEKHGVSHGYTEVARSGHVIEAHRTFEISPLHIEDAANKLTHVQGNKEHNMLSSKATQRAKELLGLDVGNQLEQISEKNDALAEKATEQNLEFKESDAPESNAEAEKELTAEVEDQKAAVPPEEDEEEEMEDPKAPSKDVGNEADMVALVGFIGELTQAVKELRAEIDGIKSDMKSVEKEEPAPDTAPQSFDFRKAIESLRGTLESPAEKSTTEPAGGVELVEGHDQVEHAKASDVTGSPFLNGLIANSRQG